MPSSMDLVSLPTDVFLLILSYLSPKDHVRCFRVDKRWHKAFADDECCRRSLLQHYPRAREVRARLQPGLSSRATSSPHEYCDFLAAQSWRNIFTVVATRYHFLTHGQPRCVQKLPLQRSLVKPSWSRYHGISPWQKYLQFEDKRAPFHYPDSLWTYNDGLLVFPSATEQKYVLYDLVEGKIDDIPFDSEGKVVRRMRLKDDVLLIEWCEAEPYHMLNESEEVHRHFATAYDLVFDGDSRRWSTTFRNEWKIHFLGMPLNSRDRFFSSHSRSHYALYLWQPNRSAWGEDEPIEALAVWDISSPSMYRPSTDSTGQAKPDESAEGARVVRRLSFSDLDFYGIRQRSTPCFRGLAIDEKQVYFTEEDHRWIDGDQSGAVLPRIHKVKTTSIPFHVGPMRQDECGADGDVNMSFCQRETELREPWMAPCWRHEVEKSGEVLLLRSVLNVF